jgi:uncharacterized protein YcfJ
MKKFLAIFGLMLSATAHAYDYTDQAQVLSSEPIYSSGGTHQECYDEPANSSNGSALNAGTVIGGIAGGLLGHQVGGGNGKTAATAVGAVTGAFVGNNINNSGAGTSRNCRTVSDQPTISGYRVTYQFAGHRGTVTMRQNPGAYVNVGVVVIQ